MRPTTRELVEGIASALERQVVPTVQDKWAASVLRSSIQLLGHLAVRVQDEARILIEQIDDASAVLRTIAPRLSGNGPELVVLCNAVTQALEAPVPPPHDVEALASLDDALQFAIEQLLRQREVLATTKHAQDTHAALLAHLRRRLGREQHLYLPVFTTPPF